MTTTGTQLSKDYAKKNTKNKIKEYCVTQWGNKYYYPPTIPKERSNSAKKLCIAICILLSAGAYILTSLKFTTVLVYLCMGFIGNFVIHLFYRLILIREEYQHVKTRYGNSYFQIWKDAFSFPQEAVVAVLAAIVCISFLRDDWNIEVTFSIRLFLFSFITFLLGKFFDLESSPLHSSLQISQINGLDYGSGMAYSFYNGYLKLILTETGHTDKSLKQLMEIYEGKHSVQFEVYKLFILIPISLRCFISLKNEFSPSVDESDSLPEKQITVAGVQNRVYKNAVYKIDCGNNIKKYVAAEYATPLKTFNDVVTSSGDHATYYRKHRNEISLQFYLTLRNILKSTNLDEICELIFYEDTYLDENGQTIHHDVGQILLARLKDIKKNQKRKFE